MLSQHKRSNITVVQSGVVYSDHDVACSSMKTKRNITHKISELRRCQSRQFNTLHPFVACRGHKHSTACMALTVDGE